MFPIKSFIKNDLGVIRGSGLALNPDGVAFHLIHRLLP